MPYELGRALLLSEAITPAALARALVVVAKEGVPLPRVLVALGFIAPHKLDEELARAEAPAVENVVPVRALIDALPSGLCSRLLALPVRVDPRTGTIDVAVADTRDAHGAREIGFFLKAPVRVVRAPLAALERALDRSTAPPPASDAPSLPYARAFSARAPGAALSPQMRKLKETPAWGTPVPRQQVPSQPRVAILPEARGGVAPIESDLPPVLQALSPSRFPRSNPAAHALLAHEPARTPSYTPSPPQATPSLPFADGSHHVSAMRAGTARDEVLQALLAGTRMVARRVALFVVKRDVFVGWRCTTEFGDEQELRKVRISVTLPSALATAATVGRYLGPLHENEAHAPLLQLMGEASRDVAMTVVRVKGLPTMLIVADELGDTALSTRRIDELARTAGEALTRILQRAR